MTAASGAWGHRPFRYLLLGRTVSLVGNGLAGLAVTFAVLDLTGSTTDLGLVLAARSLPMVVVRRLTRTDLGEPARTAGGP